VLKKRIADKTLPLGTNTRVEAARSQPAPPPAAPTGPKKQPRKAKEEIIAADARLRGGKKKRLELLSDAPPTYEFPAPQLARRYYEESRLCFYSGAYVATIIMAQLAFEELLRTYYRAVEGEGCLPDGSKVADCGFADLIIQARREKLASGRDVRRLEKLRMMRNPYVHSRAEGRKSDQTRQTLKITFPEYVGVSTEDEARKAVTTLIEVFPILSHKIWGEEDSEEFAVDAQS
jgi:hypothetical protein